MQSSAVKLVATAVCSCDARLACVPEQHVATRIIDKETRRARSRRKITFPNFRAHCTIEWPRVKINSRGSPDVAAGGRGRGTDWAIDGACRDFPAVDFFTDVRSAIAHAKSICFRCPVWDECLEFAVRHDEIGVWGGTTRRERRRLESGRRLEQRRFRPVTV
jgi:WhiB family redox-sensing transcriptional regulator